MTSISLGSYAILALLTIIVYGNLSLFFPLDPKVSTVLKSIQQQQQSQQQPQTTGTTTNDNHNNNHNDNDNDKNCLRFATINIDKSAGLGHRFSELVMGMNLARATNASFVYQTEHWSNGRPELHGSYPWWNEFFPLQDTRYATSAGDFVATEALVGDHALSIHRGHFDHLVEVSKDPSTPRCNVLFSMRGLRSCCPKDTKEELCWCAKQPERIGAYENVKEILREVYTNHTRYVPPKSPLELPPGDDNSDGVAAAPSDVADNHKRVVTVSVAWHIRLGDIVLNARLDFFARIANHVAKAFRDANKVVDKKNIVLEPRVFWFGEGGKERIHGRFPFVAVVCREYFGNRCTYKDTDPRDTLWGMIHSDILVTSGSSFPIMATELRTRGIVLAAETKARSRVADGVYKVSEQVDIDRDGNIPGIRKLRDFLVEEDWAK